MNYDQQNTKEMFFWSHIHMYTYSYNIYTHVHYKYTSSIHRVYIVMAGTTRTQQGNEYLEQSSMNKKACDHTSDIQFKNGGTSEGESLNRVRRTLWWCQASGGPTDGRGTVCVCFYHVTWQDSTCVAQRRPETVNGMITATQARGLSRVPVVVHAETESGREKCEKLCIGKLGHGWWWIMAALHVIIQSWHTC